MVEGAQGAPYGSTDQGGDQAVPLADRGRVDAPLVTLAVAVAGGEQDAIALHVHHHGVNRTLVAARIQSHAVNQIRARLRSVLNQGSANGDADDAVEVHRGGVVN